MITYEVRERPTSWAVVRVGRRGGLRVVAVYDAPEIAQSAADTLNGWTDREL